MIKSERKKIAALVTRKAWGNFGRDGFRVDPRGAHWQPLKDAERYGWVRWVGDSRCGLTDEGIRLAIEYEGVLS